MNFISAIPVLLAVACGVAIANESDTKAPIAYLNEGVDEIIVSKYVNTNCTVSNWRKISLHEVKKINVYGVTECRGGRYLKFINRGESMYANINDFAIAPYDVAMLSLDGKLGQSKYQELEEQEREQTKSQYRSNIDAAKSLLRSTSKNGIAITKFRAYSSGDNDYKGLNVGIFNSGDKAIKYVVISAQGINRVKDAIGNSGRGGKPESISITGPIEKGDTLEVKFPKVWLTNQVVDVRIVSLKIEYFDATSKKILDQKIINSIVLPQELMAVLDE